MKSALFYAIKLSDLVSSKICLAADINSTPGETHIIFSLESIAAENMSRGINVFSSNDTSMQYQSSAEKQRTTSFRSFFRITQPFVIFENIYPEH